MWMCRVVKTVSSSYGSGMVKTELEKEVVLSSSQDGG